MEDRGVEDVEEDADIEAIVAAIKAYEWKAEDLEAEEIELLQKHEVEVEGAEDAEDADGEADPLLEATLAFCTSQGVEGVEDDMDLDQLKELIDGYEYPEEQLSAEEIETLESLELAGNIKRKEKKAPAKKAAPAPAAKGKVAPKKKK